MRRVELTCTWPSGRYEILPENPVTVQVAALDSGDQKTIVETIHAVMQAEAFPVPDSQYEYTTYTWDGAYASLEGIGGVIIPQYEDTYLTPLSQNGTVEFDGGGTAAANLLQYHQATVRGNINAYALQLWLYLGDKNSLIPICSPASGHVDPDSATVLQWSLKPAGFSAVDPAQTSAVVTWRVRGGAERTRSVTTANSVTLSAGSFHQGDVIEWKVAVTADTGITEESAWMTLTTVDGAATAAPISPVNGIVDGTAPVLFRWSHTTEFGTAQTGAELQQSTSGSGWTTFASVTGSEQQVTVPAGTLAAGTDGAFFWRVRTANADGDFGEWSAPAQCVVVAPPPAPNVSVDAVPEAVIRWTSVGQEGYQVQAAGYDTGALYGIATEWTVPEALPDGSYTARVRVVNGFGLWSEWGEWTFTIANKPDAAITLQGAGGTTALLNWTITPVWRRGAIASIDGVTESSSTARLCTGYLPRNVTALACNSDYKYIVFGYTSDGDYLGTWDGEAFSAAANWLTDPVSMEDLAAATWFRLVFARSNNAAIGVAAASNMTITTDDGTTGLLYTVYRDGVRIGETTILAMQDNRAGAGPHVYTVRGRKPGSGYYAESNAVTLTIRLDTVELIDEETGELLTLPMALAGDVYTSGTRNRAVTLQHWNGAGLPSAEIGAARDNVLQLRPSFPTAHFDLAGRLEALLGKLVHYRDPYGHGFYGIMAAMGFEKHPTRRSYDLTITEVDYDPADRV